MLIRFIAEYDDGSKEPFDISDTDLRNGDHVARIIAGERQRESSAKSGEESSACIAIRLFPIL